MKSNLLALAAVVLSGTAWAAWPTDPMVDLVVSRQSSNSGAEIRALAHDGQGGYFVAWNQDLSGMPLYDDVYMEHVNANGDLLWNTATDGGVIGKLVVTGTGAQSAFGIVADGSGGFFLGYYDTGNAIRIVRFDSAVMPVAGFNNFMATGSVAAMRTDGAGGLYVMTDTGTATSVVRIDSMGVPITGPVLAASHSDLRTVHMSLDTAGGLVVGYSKYVSPYVTRLNASLQANLNAYSGTGLDTQSGSSQDTCGDGAGGAWSMVQAAQGGGGAVQVYVQHYAADGGVSFRVPDGGVAPLAARVTSTNGLERILNAEADGTGGLLAYWGDSRSGNSLPMLQRYDSAGNAMFNAGGIVMATAAMTYRANGGQVPLIVRQGIDATALWGADNPSTVRAARYELDGGRPWAYGGVLISSNPATYIRRLLAVGSADGTIVIGTTFYGGSGSNTGTIQLKKLLPNGTLGGFLDAGTGVGSDAGSGDAGSNPGDAGTSSDAGADAGTGADAGAGGADAGTGSGTDGGSGGGSDAGNGPVGNSDAGDGGSTNTNTNTNTNNESESKKTSSCGCNALDGSSAFAAMGLALAFARRRRRV